MLRRGGTKATPRWRIRWRTGPGWTGAALLLGGAAGSLWTWRAVEQTVPGAAGASWRILANDLLVALGLAVAVVLVGTVVAALLRRSLPVPFIAVLAVSVLLLATMGAGPSPAGWLLVCVVVVVTAPLVGGWLGSAVAARFAGGQPPGRRRRVAALGAALVVVVGAGWLAWPGPGAPDDGSARAGDVLPDPTAPGTGEVVVTTYGSAHPGAPDRYGSRAGLVTDPVDATDVIDGWAAGSLRSEVRGFDASALPVNATVWAPEEDGRHPLVLVVHGNSPHGDSELGFAYLGELLAGRGYVVAALDQGFLNTSLLDRAGGMPGADEARAWLIGRHLDQWRRWAQQGDGPAAVDLDRVGIVGHSRGGEAAAVAAAQGHGGAEVTSVVALAPSDGSDVSGGRTVRLDGVDYLTVGGSHDADVGAFVGTDQYARTTVGPGQRKAAVAVHGANHSQFNTRWGRYDAGLGLSKHLLGTAALLPASEQQQATAAFVSAFLDLTLSDDDGARPIFSGQLPSTPWLPETDYRVATTAGDQARVEGFDDDASGPSGSVSVRGGTGVVTPLPLRSGPSGNAVLHLRPDEPGGTVTLTLDDPSLAAGERVVADLADARPAGSGGDPVTVDVRLSDAAGRTATCPLTGPRGVPRQLSAQTVKLGFLQQGPTSEPHLQSFTVAAGCLADGGAALDAAESLTLRVADLPSAGVYLDNVGVAG